MDNVPPLDAVTFSVTRYNLWVACRLQSIGDMMKSEMERNRLFREEVRHSLVQLQAEVERLANNGNANNNNNNAAAAGYATPNGNHSDDPRFDVSARISDMLGSTSASITEALLESDSQPASLLAPYGLIPPPAPRLPVVPLAPTHSTQPPQHIKREEEEMKEIVVGEEDEDEEEDEVSDVEEIKNEVMVEEKEATKKMNGPKVELKARNKKATIKSGNRGSKNNYIDEWKKRRARELASARMRRFRERQKLKKEMVANLSSDY